MQSQFQNSIGNRLLYETLVGSQAYGLARPDSDEDIKGVFVDPVATLLTLRQLPEQISDDRNDIVYFSLRRFLELALQANPTLIELLYMPEECVRFIHPAFQQVLDQRDAFLTLRAYDSHVKYAQAQIRKAKGRNKWINQPQPKEPPAIERFCWFIPIAQGNRPPYRPAPLAEAGIDLKQCRASAVEHAHNTFRLYDYRDQECDGVVRGGKVFCESIPFEDENRRCIGLLIFNEDEFKRAVRDHKNYWTWRENRNESRWVAQESGLLDYDAKNMAHMFRLLYSAERILTQGEPLVRFSGEKQQFLMSILHGQYSYEDLMCQAEKLNQQLDRAKSICQLPEAPDPSVAEALLRNVTADWEAGQPS